MITTFKELEEFLEREKLDLRCGVRRRFTERPRLAVLTSSIDYGLVVGISGTGESLTEAVAEAVKRRLGS